LPATDTIKFLSRDEAGRLFHELGENKRNKAIFLVANCHGLRASEVGLLRTGDLSPAQRQLALASIVSSLTKLRPSKRTCANAINGSPILFTSNRHDPISRQALDWLMKSYGAVANLPPE
jgi:integrase/recombinase XerD